MADKNPLTPEEVTELFSEIDASGVLIPRSPKKRTERMREKEAAAKRGDKAALAQLRSEDRASRAKHIDPLSEDDPSGSQVSSYHYEDRDGRGHRYFGADRGHADRLRRDAPSEYRQPVRRAFRLIPFLQHSGVDSSGATALRSSRSTLPSMKPMSVRARSR